MCVSRVRGIFVQHLRVPHQYFEISSVVRVCVCVFVYVCVYVQWYVCVHARVGM